MKEDIYKELFHKSLLFIYNEKKLLFLSVLQVNVVLITCTSKIKAGGSTWYRTKSSHFFFSHFFSHFLTYTFSEYLYLCIRV